ncbi:aminoglycoside phosphotransferase family protein [Thauera linaloolentis]|uniref:Aminoglycoside phosphotransferase n=1 Tax=Thauera linaloolentis (strain DSM 12138 / JCM 21573 / CCUG 41526 / CIP 105981 / IAM 15112 / NBRC 102519 / 47Lol) TaxID=1123367 RepID=N6ZE06_THAL4|nr:phosphotransferase [Thauera linaloolentis]ENO90369.1 aminoglycoside phosphotransferase [Thauera linaloolentis 47Lol = DSM 12138]MCM8564056.1 phosphotransferase [Thauera linaloolentis]
MQRLEQLRAWLASILPGQAFNLAPASADASFRRYFRATFADGGPSRIVMDAPPEKEDIRPWLQVAALFRNAGAHVPDVLAQDLEHGFLLLSDLGATTYLSALQTAGGADLHDAAHLYADALGALAAIQHASRPGVLPEYDRALLLREMMLFPEWYIARHKNTTLSDAEAAQLRTVFDRILDVNLAEPRVFVHRDYHSRNLMRLAPGDGLGPNPGIIDFQDAVHGPITYDLVSLFKDAYIRWDEEFILDLLIRYWETAKKLGLPVRGEFADFHRDFEWMGVQRHLKVLGIFARLHHRDGKGGYLADMPLVMDYLRRACKRYRDLGPLLKLLDRLDPEDTQVGYTF